MKRRPINLTDTELRHLSFHPTPNKTTTTAHPPTHHIFRYKQKQLSWENYKYIISFESQIIPVLKCRNSHVYLDISSDRQQFF